MAIKTIRDKLEYALEQRGFRKATSIGGAHVWIDPGNEDRKLFLGTAGSLRIGRIKTGAVTADSLKKTLLAEYEASKRPKGGEPETKIEDLPEEQQKAGTTRFLNAVFGKKEH